MEREAWRATVHSVTKSQTQLKQLSTHTQSTDTLKPIKQGMVLVNREEYFILLFDFKIFNEIHDILNS